MLYAPYQEQLADWPKSGRHIMAQFDDDSVIVYQAYRPAIGHFAAKNGYFGGSAFSLERMSWIKPNFLWMMYRCGWGTKDGQQVTLAVHLKRSAFDTILAQAVHSTYVPEVYGTQDAWKQAVAHSNVRLQWDPDHDPIGGKLERRAIQLGLQGAALTAYSQNWLLEIEDISAFVAEQRKSARPELYDKLSLPVEKIYPVDDPEVATKLGLADSDF